MSLEMLCRVRVDHFYGIEIEEFPARIARTALYLVDHLEDAGIPARVIDELMGHEPSRRGDTGGSRIGARYRHTTPEMATRVADAVEQKLAVVLREAERAVENKPNQAALRVF